MYALKDLIAFESEGLHYFFVFVFIEYLDKHYTEKWLHKQK